jgi:hypothetical protein
VSWNKDTLYMAVTMDKYELPVYIEKSAVLLAKKLGISRNSVYSCISYGNSGKYLGLKIIRLKLEKEDEIDG